MTTYSPIANGSVDAGSPIDESLVTALRDNPIALSEGAAGAPRIATIAADANDGTTTAGTTAAITNSSVAYKSQSNNASTRMQGVIKVARSYTFSFTKANVYKENAGSDLTIRVYCGTTLVVGAFSSDINPSVILDGTGTHTASAGDVWYVETVGDTSSLKDTANILTVSISTNSGGDCFTRVTDGAIT